MKSKASLLLMEQLVMVLVFALAAALCLQVFLRADQISTEIRTVQTLEAKHWGLSLGSVLTTSQWLLCRLLHASKTCTSLVGSCEEEVNVLV